MNTETVRAPRLLDQVRGKLRALHYSLHTEEAHLDWIKRFIRFHGKRHPRELGAEEMAAFLTHLASDRKVSASTQDQVLAGCCFSYRRAQSAGCAGVVLGRVRPGLRPFPESLLTPAPGLLCLPACMESSAPVLGTSTADLPQGDAEVCSAAPGL